MPNYLLINSIDILILTYSRPGLDLYRGIGSRLVELLDHDMELELAGQHRPPEKQKRGSCRLDSVSKEIGPG